MTTIGSNLTHIDLEKYPGITEEMLNKLLGQAAEEIKEDNYIQIHISWSFDFILNYNDGMAVLEKLRKAESMEDVSGQKAIRPFKGDVDFKILSRSKYIEMKLLYLLDKHKEEPKPKEDESS